MVTVNVDASLILISQVKSLTDQISVERNERGRIIEVETPAPVSVMFRGYGDTWWISPPLGTVIEEDWIQREIQTHDYKELGL